MINNNNQKKKKNEVVRIDYFDWNYETILDLKVTINVGDRMNLHCVYNSIERNKQTKMGFAEMDEMVLLCLFVCLFACLFVCVCLFIYLFVCLFVCLFFFGFGFWVWDIVFVVFVLDDLMFLI